VPTALSPSQARYMDYVGDWLAKLLAPGSRVFEIGCHDSYLLKRLADRGHRCEGIEPSPFAEYGRQEYGLPIDRGFFKGGVYPDRAYDLVIARHVVEHVETPAAFVRDAARLVRDGGFLYVEVPNSLVSVEQTFFPEFHTRHLSYFTPASLHDVLVSAGLADVVHEETVWAYMKFPFINALARRGTNPPVRPAWFVDFRIEAMFARFRARWERYLGGLRTLERGPRLAVWGAGSIGIQFAVDAGWQLGDATYVDINAANHGLLLPVTGHEVEPPDVLRARDVSTVLIASGWEDDVRVQVRPHLPHGARLMAFSDLLAGATA
jgi:SAM-dependent methyltransferase